MNMGLHIKKAAKIGSRVVAALSRLMPNIGGSKAGRRRVFGNVANLIVLYGAPAWKECIKVSKHRRVIKSTQRGPSK